LGVVGTTPRQRVHAAQRAVAAWLSARMALGRCAALAVEGGPARGRARARCLAARVAGLVPGRGRRRASWCSKCPGWAPAAIPRPGHCPPLRCCSRQTAVAAPRGGGPAAAALAASRSWAQQGRGLRQGGVDWARMRRYGLPRRGGCHWCVQGRVLRLAHTAWPHPRTALESPTV
jgi:hypothetical protein